MKKRRFAAPACLLASMLAAGFGCSSGVGSTSPTAADSEDSGGEEAVRVSTTPPAVRTIAEEVTLSGTLSPYEQVTLFSRVDGYLRSIGYDIGDFMQRGEVIAQIDVPEMAATLNEKRAAVTRAEAALEQARAAIEQHEAEVKFERLNHERLSAIRSRKQEVLPQHEVDRAEAAAGVAAGKLRKARADLLVAEAELEGARAELESLERMAEYARLKAPITGVITERFVDPGDLVQAASTSRTQVAPIVSIARLDRIRLLVDVPEPQAPFVQKGTRARISVAGLEPLEATVSRTSEALDPSSRTLRAEIDIANPRNRLRPGMTAEVALATRTVEEAMTVPVSAVRVSGDAYYVFVARDGQVERRPVTVGVESAEWIQIVDGLEPTDAVVTAFSEPLEDGVRIIRAAVEERAE